MIILHGLLTGCGIVLAARVRNENYRIMAVGALVVTAGLSFHFLIAT